MPWLLLRPVDGAEDIYAPRVWHLDGNGWHGDEEWEKTRGRPSSAARNPRRMVSAWNHAWGPVDCGNRHETELPRLGLTPANASQSGD